MRYPVKGTWKEAIASLQLVYARPLPNRELQAISRSSETFLVDHSRIGVEFPLASAVVERLTTDEGPGARLIRVCEGFRASTETVEVSRKALLKLNKRHMVGL